MYRYALGRFCRRNDGLNMHLSKLLDKFRQQLLNLQRGFKEIFTKLLQVLITNQTEISVCMNETYVLTTFVAPVVLYGSSAKLLNF